MTFILEYMTKKYNRKDLEKRFPNIFETIYAIMEYESWEADELEKRWIKENVQLNINSALQEFKFKN